LKSFFAKQTPSLKRYLQISLRLASEIIIVSVGDLARAESRTELREENVVGREESFALLQILEVTVVELSWSGCVHVDGDSWVNCLGTSQLKFFSVGFV
jgi:hypothetical protein